jgi:hypothetical protein
MKDTIQSLQLHDMRFMAKTEEEHSPPMHALRDKHRDSDHVQAYGAFAFRIRIRSDVLEHMLSECTIADLGKFPDHGIYVRVILRCRAVLAPF